MFNYLKVNYHLSSCIKPILRRVCRRGSLAWSSANASLMASSCARVDSLMSIATNARVTIMLVPMATSLRRTLASANAPCSVNAKGKADLGRLALDVSAHAGLTPLRVCPLPRTSCMPCFSCFSVQRYAFFLNHANYSRFFRKPLTASITPAITLFPVLFGGLEKTA